MIEPQVGSIIWNVMNVGNVVNECGNVFPFISILISFFSLLLAWWVRRLG
jgi:hypothetical protein